MLEKIKEIYKILGKESLTLSDFIQYLAIKPEKKTCFVIGHYLLSGGLYSRFLKSNEYNYHIEKIKPLLEAKGYKVFTHKSLGYSSRQKSMSDLTASYDWVVELHFNGVASPEANGCEFLYWFSNLESKKKAQDICADINSEMGIKVRRDKGALAILSKDERGGGFLTSTKGNALIAEPFFGSNQSDCEKFDHEKYVEILSRHLK